MFHHVKELQFNARVSEPDPRFASMLLEQFGGANGELTAALTYFVQAFTARQPYPDKYDMLMDIALEEFSHLEIVGATITMLLGNTGAQLRDTAEQSEVVQLVNGSLKKEELIHRAWVNPQFFAVSAGGPRYTDSQGVPWTGAYVKGNGDLTFDLRHDMSAETGAKAVYEYLMQFTDDPYVKDTLSFLMTREIAHYNMFAAALNDIQPNFPPGIHKGDPRFSHLYFNMSNGASSRGPWNKGQGPWGDGEEWVYVENPVDHVVKTKGLTRQKVEGTPRDHKDIQREEEALGKMRSKEVASSMPKGGKGNQWSDYPQKGLSSPKKMDKTI